MRERCVCDVRVSMNTIVHVYICIWIHMHVCMYIHVNASALYSTCMQMVREKHTSQYCFGKMFLR